MVMDLPGFKSSTYGDDSFSITVCNCRLQFEEYCNPRIIFDFELRGKMFAPQAVSILYDLKDGWRCHFLEFDREFLQKLKVAYCDPARKQIEEKGREIEVNRYLALKRRVRDVEDGLINRGIDLDGANIYQDR